MRWLRDPLVVFLGVGALMFLAASHFSDEEISYVVELDEEDVERISDKWATQMRRPPSEQELSELVADFVRDEIYYREAQRLSLNANDSIVRARMIQKLTFLTEDIATGVSLSDEALRQYYSENEKDYAVPQRYSFSHRYFSTDKRTDPQRDAMKAIVSGEKGDLFLAGHNYLEQMFWNYCYLNRGLTIDFNGNKLISKNGLKDLLENNMDGDPLYPIIHLEGEDIEVAFTHARGYGEDYSSFVNGQHTTQGGTHLSAFREAVARVIKDFFNKYEPVDIRQGIVAAVSIKVIEPVFESQTKTKLGSLEIEPNGKSVRAFVMDFLKEKLDNFLHRNPEISLYTLLSEILPISETAIAN